MIYDNTPTVVVGLIQVLKPKGEGPNYPSLNKNSDVGIIAIQRAGSLGWALPGGFQERPEQIKYTLVREIKEETGIIFDPAYHMHLVDLVTVPDGSVNLALFQLFITWEEFQRAMAEQITNGMPQPEEVVGMKLVTEPFESLFPIHTEWVKNWFIGRSQMYW